MKQASGLLGTRACPGLTISKPKKLKVRSSEAAKERRDVGWVLQTKLNTPFAPHLPPMPPRRWHGFLARTPSHQASLSYLCRLYSCGSKWRHGPLEVVLQQTQEELQNWRKNRKQVKTLVFHLPAQEVFYATAVLIWAEEKQQKLLKEPAVAIYSLIISWGWMDYRNYPGWPLPRNATVKNWF